METQRVTQQRSKGSIGAKVRSLGWQTALAAVLMTALVVWFVPDGAASAVLTAMTTADPWMLAAALALYPLVALARAVRLLRVQGLPLTARGLWVLGKVAAAHSILASYAPMRLGEFSLIWLLNRAMGTSVATGSALLLVMRVVDLVVVVGAGGLALAWLPAARVAWPQAGPVAGLAVLALLVGLALAPLLARRLDCLTPLLPGRLGRFAGDVLRAVGAMTAGSLLRLLGWSVLVWLPIFAIAWVCANAADGVAAIGLAGGVAGGSATALASVLPVNTVANVGTFEAAWMLALVPAGLDAATALATGVMFHAVVLLGSAILGLLALPGLLRGGASRDEDGSPA